jgi:hypothetical protein
LACWAQRRADLYPQRHCSSVEPAQELTGWKADPTCSLIALAKVLSPMNHQIWCRLGSNQMPVSPIGA